MHARLSPVFSGILCAALLAGTPLQARQPGNDNKQPANVVIHLPTDAELYIEGIKSKQVGATREFETPALQPGKVFTYNLKAVWMEDGKEVVKQLKVKVEAGKTTKIDVTQESVEAPPPPPPVGDAAIQAPAIDGYVICLERRRVQGRVGKGFKRTVSEYQAFFDRQPIAGMNGNAVERQGPGDNSNAGVSNHARLKEGTYSLFTHAGDRNRYRTFGFANPGGLQSRAWPSIRVGGTGARSGVLIHCAAGFLMSTGCINLTGKPLKLGKDDIEFFDSRSRVIGLIQNMKARLGAKFPTSNNVKIPDATLVIRGEP